MGKGYWYSARGFGRTQRSSDVVMRREAIVDADNRERANSHRVVGKNGNASFSQLRSNGLGIRPVIVVAENRENALGGL